jgi:hypothetical protein
VALLAPRAEARCAQPVTDGAAPTATDCLFILKAAVGIAQCQPSCVCDVNGDSSATATDALSCLNIAVGNDLPLACPCMGSTTTTLMAQPGPCCVRGTCSIALPEQCGGIYLGPSDSIVCSAAEKTACKNPPTTTTTTTTVSTTTTLGSATGACCGPRRCSIQTEASCNGVYLGDSDHEACTTTDEAACIAAMTTTTSTTTTTLASVTGACCGPRGCSVVTPEDCQGIYLGDSEGFACTAQEIAACAEAMTTTTTTSFTTTTTMPPGGACCIRGFCVVELPEDCQGTYLGDGVPCTPENQGVCESL